MTQPLAAYTLGFYGQDEWKVTPSLTLIYGMRLEHNSNPTCGTSCFSLLSGNFNTVSTATTTPYSSLITSGQHTAFRQLQKVAYEPRVGFSWAPFGQGSHTQIRGGFGFFSDAFPLQIADSLFNNAPTNVYLTLGIFGGTPDYPLYSGAAGSYASQAAASNAAFQAGFQSNQSKTNLSTIPGFSAPGFTNVASKISYPTYEEYSLQVQQQLTTTTAINVAYNGNHGYHEPYLNNGINAYNSGHIAGFPSLPASIPNPNFSAVTEIYSGSSSNYNGLIVSVINRSKMLTTQFNYTYSHALDEVSNGGLNSFASIYVSPYISTPLKQNYGNADYDTRHYFSGNYVFNLPYYGGPRFATQGWQITGDVFHSTGLPFTFSDSLTSAGFSNFGGTLFAKQTAAHMPNKCSGGNIQNVATGKGTPCTAAGDVTLATDFGQQHRNQVFGPSYTDTDIALSKGFSLSRHSTGGEGVSLRVGLQAFNVLNHPNFAQPLHDSNNGALEGTINSTVNTPTSILGSLLGGDASPRLVQLKAKLSF